MLYMKVVCRSPWQKHWVETERNSLIRQHTKMQRLLENKEAKNWSLQSYHKAVKNSMITSKYGKQNYLSLGRSHSFVFWIAKMFFEKLCESGRPYILWICYPQVYLMTKKAKSSVFKTIYCWSQQEPYQLISVGTDNV